MTESTFPVKIEPHLVTVTRRFCSGRAGLNRWPEPVKWSSPGADPKLVDAAGPDHGQQSLKRRSLEGRAGVALIIESLLNHCVAQRAPGLNVGPAQVELDLT